MKKIREFLHGRELIFKTFLFIAAVFLFAPFIYSADDTLAVTGLTASPAAVSTGEIITVIMTLNDTGTNGLNSVQPGSVSLIDNSGQAAYVNVQPATMAIAANGTGTFTFTFNATSTGSLKFTNIPGSESGIDNVSSDTVIATGNLTSNNVTIQTPAALVVSGITSTSPVAEGQTISVIITVQNTGQDNASGVLPNQPAVSGTAILSPLTTPSAQSIAGGGSANFIYTYSYSSPASFMFTTNGGSAGTDQQTGATAGWTDNGYSIKTIVEATLGELIVNSTADNDDGIYGNGHDTLRECLNIANSMTSNTTIHFAASIAEGTINLTGDLPYISNASGSISVDGQSRNIVINGNNHFVFYMTNSNNNKILNLSVINAQRGVMIYKSNGNIVSGCRIGVDWSNNTGEGNNMGVVIHDSSGNTIGGDALPTSGSGTYYGNVISGNTDNGILIFGDTIPTTNNMILSNFIGTDSYGTKALPNGGNGVDIDGEGADADFNTVGYGNEGNLISGNAGDGVLIEDSSYENGVFGNVIGGNISVFTGNSSSAAVIPNQTDGVAIDDVDAKPASKDSCSIGGYNPLEGNGTYGSGKYDQPGNTIVGNSSSGINITHYTSYAYVGNNSIGVMFGNKSAGNVLYGVLIDNTAEYAYVNSNLISGQNVTNTSIGSGIETDSAEYCYIYNNIIGLDASLSVAMPNSIGLNIINSEYVMIGDQGNTSSANVISGNINQGILFEGGNYNGVYCNFIGTANQSDGDFGNKVGIAVENDATEDEIGSGVGSGDENYIMNNTVKGIEIGSGPADDVANIFVNSNYITNNNGLGIDLGNDGITINGSQTAPGPNNWVNYPTITNAYMSDPTTMHIDGDTNTLNGSNMGVIIAISENDGQQMHGESPVPIAYITATGGLFHADLDITPYGNLSGVTLTSYDVSDYGSSEYSPNFWVFATEPTFTMTVTDTMTQTPTFTATFTITPTPTMTPMCACVTTQSCFVVENPSDPLYQPPAYQYNFDGNFNDSFGGLNATETGSLSFVTGLSGQAVSGFSNSSWVTLCGCQLRQQDCAIDWDEYINPSQNTSLYGPAILDALLGQGQGTDTSQKYIGVFLDEDSSNTQNAAVRVLYTLNTVNSTNQIELGGLNTAGWYNIRVSWTGAMGVGLSSTGPGIVKLVVIKDGVGLVGEQDSSPSMPIYFGTDISNKDVDVGAAWGGANYINGAIDNLKIWNCVTEAIPTVTTTPSITPTSTIFLSPTITPTATISPTVTQTPEFTSVFAYPNPVKTGGEVTIAYPVKGNTTEVDLVIYAINGDKVADVTETSVIDGELSFKLNNKLSSGVYFYKVTVKHDGIQDIYKFKKFAVVN